MLSGPRMLKPVDGPLAGEKAASTALSRQICGRSAVIVHRFGDMLDSCSAGFLLLEMVVPPAVYTPPPRCLDLTLRGLFHPRQSSRCNVRPEILVRSRNTSSDWLDYGATPMIAHRVYGGNRVLSARGIAPGPVRATEPATAGAEQFEKQVQPLLAAKCWKCHGRGAATRPACGSIRPRPSPPAAIRASHRAGRSRT